MTDTARPPSPFSSNIPSFQTSIVQSIQITPKREVAFKANLTLKGECWEWGGPFVHNGYGQFNIGGRTGTNVRTHRMAYEVWVGTIPVGRMVLHSCDNRKCCNPVHLFLGTAKDNTADMLSKGRASGGAVERWTPLDMETAIRLRKAGKSCQQIANILNNEFSHETVRLKLKEAGAWSRGSPIPVLI